MKKYFIQIFLFSKVIFCSVAFCFSAFGANISVADATTPNEKPVSQTVVVFMSSAQSFDVEVDYETADGTATKNEDYLPVSGRLTFRPGETVKAISIAILDDKAAEKKETIIVELKNASFGTLRDSQAFVYITDDDS
tara:strand:- start:7 stop:417 length:411 start_codon:yes stop_codon:yes gene_type:complete